MRRAAVLLALAACQGPPAGLAGPVAIDAAPPGPDGRAGCDPLAQDCQGGQACTLVGAGRYDCVETLGLPRYHTCLGSGHCSPGDDCMLDDFVDFYCIAYCDHARYGGVRDPDHCDVSEICAELDGDIGRCLGICQPLAGACPVGLACYLVPDGADICYPVLGDGAPGAACARDNQCRPGSGCLGEPRVCTVYCDHENYPDEPEPRCASGQVCGALPGEDEIGACVPAP